MTNKIQKLLANKYANCYHPQCRFTSRACWFFQNPCGGDTMSSVANNTEAVLATPLMQAPAKKKKLSASNHQRMTHEQKKESEKTKQSAQSTTIKKVMSEQEKKGIELKLKKQRDSMEHCNHVLQVLTRNPGGPQFWLRPEYKQIRHWVEAMKSHPQQFSRVICAELSDCSIFSEGDAHEVLNIPALTSSYIVSIATFKELESDLLPIIQVVSSKMALESSSMMNK